MSYLILQIIVWLAAAALLGVAFGWIMARRDLDAKIQEERNMRTSIVADWQSRHREAVDLCDAARTRIASLESDLDILRGELHTKSERSAQLESRIERGAAELRNVQSGIAGHPAELDRVREELSGANQRLTSARAALSEKDDIIAQLQRGLADRDKQIPALHTGLRERDAETRAAQKLVVDHEARVQVLSTRLLEQETALASARARISELEAGRPARREIESQPDASQVSLFPQNVRDDLKQIRGIGPKLERTLNQMGIVTYRQIGAWSEEAIDVIQSKLEGFPERIRRDHWVAGAKVEHKKKYGEDL